MDRRLVVYVPALGRTTAEWEPLVGRLKKEPELQGAEWFAWDHDQKWYSGGRLSALGAKLASDIADRWSNLGPFDSVTLIGHSIGGIIVRKAYMVASGKDGVHKQEPPMEWADRVDRIILMAAITRGFDPRDSPFGWFIKGVLLFPGFRLARDYMIGSDVITDLRISWIRHFRELGDKQPSVIQVWAHNDTLIKHDDSLDVDQFPKAAVEQLGASHTTIPLLPKGREEDRYSRLKHIILHEQGAASAGNTEVRIKHVVFLVHGIRASTDDWPKRAKALLEKRYPDVLVVPAGYKYFSALQFAIPFRRRKQIRIMQDTYSYHFAKHRDAKFHFIGHSFGTYLLGRSLEHIPSIQYERVTLAGSVLPQEFDWTKHFGVRLTGLRNHRAVKDIPVGIFCSLLRGLGMSDVGTGGFAGFLKTDSRYAEEVAYYPGGHGAALDSESALGPLIEYTANDVAGQKSPYGVTADIAPGRLALLSRALENPVGAYLALFAVVATLLAIANTSAWLAVHWGATVPHLTSYIFIALVFLVGFVLEIL